MEKIITKFRKKFRKFTGLEKGVTEQAAAVDAEDQAPEISH